MLDYLMAKLQNILNNTIYNNYFDENYVNGRINYNGRIILTRYPLELLNMYDATIKNSARTNNIYEEWNNSFGYLTGQTNLTSGK